ncbi:MAG: VWA domain-containing protein [Microbacteriaceae bacterium]
MSALAFASAALTIDPVIPVPVLIVGALLVIGLGVATAVRGGRRPGAHWTGPALRAIAVLLLVVVALRPAIPADSAGPTASGGLEVYFVLDTTSSMAAEDADTAQLDERVPPPTLADGTVNAARRLDAARADILRIADALEGARFSLVTFDSETVQRVPLTSDESALESTLQVLTQEVTEYSQGSAIDEAVPDVEEILTKAEDAAPGDTRVLFYLGDGEQTSDEPVGSFASLAPLISGGGVLGYGTETGGRMRSFSGYSYGDTDSDSDSSGVDEVPGYIQDPSTGEAAVSTIDEDALRTIASQLGVDYSHRTDADVSALVAGMDVGELTVEPGDPAEPTELYWIAAIPLTAILLVELFRLGRPLSELRRARPSGPRRARGGRR